MEAHENILMAIVGLMGMAIFMLIGAKWLEQEALLRQCPAGRVFQYRVGSGRVLDKIPGIGSGSGRVGVSKYTIGYFRVSLLFSGIFGYVGYFRVYLGLPWGVPGKLLLVPPHPSPLYKKIRRTVFETFPLSSQRKFQELHNINMI